MALGAHTHQVTPRPRHASFRAPLPAPASAPALLGHIALRRTLPQAHKAAAPQASFRIDSVGVARSTLDYYPPQVMNTIIAGSFTSRLNRRLREETWYMLGLPDGFEAIGDIAYERATDTLHDVSREEPVSGVQKVR